MYLQCLHWIIPFHAALTIKAYTNKSIYTLDAPLYVCIPIGQQKQTHPNEIHPHGKQFHFILNGHRVERNS